MNINEVLPQNVKFNLNNKEYELRPLTISDMAWFERDFGGISKVIEILKTDGLYDKKYKLVYNQLVDKSDFLSREITEVNIEGDEIKKKISGPEIFYRSISTRESNNPIIALTQVIILSLPDDSKKKVEKVKKEEKE